MGAALHAEQVTMVDTATGRTRGVTTRAGTTAAGHVVLAAGVWAPQIAGLPRPLPVEPVRSEEHTSELQSLTNLVCRLLLEKKKKTSETRSYRQCFTQRKPRAMATPQP